jgi:hypothetical protein
MCGGFAASVGALCPRMPAGLLNQGIYTAGRIFTYGFLGAVAGLAGARLGVAFASVQQVVAVLAGVLMIGIGCSILGLSPLRRLQKILGWHGSAQRTRESLVNSVGSPNGIAARYDDGLAAPFFGYFLRPQARPGVFLAGVFTGFLPCGLVYAFLALAASTADPLSGWIGMACFGLGTAPAMVLAGGGAALLAARWRSLVQRFAAAFVILLGAVTIHRGLWSTHGRCHVETHACALHSSPP